MTNSSASASYVATVPRACTLEPWPVSVIAKQPIVRPVTRSARWASWWVFVPSWRIAPPKRPNCTPTFTSTDRSPKARVSKAAIEAPMSPPPPYSSGNPMPVWPVPAIITTTSLTRSRKSAVRHLLLVEEDLRVLGEVGAHQVADLAVAAVEQGAQRVDVDVRLAVAAVVGVDGVVLDPLRGGCLGQRRGHLVRDRRDLVGGHTPKVVRTVGSPR